MNRTNPPAVIVPPPPASEPNAPHPTDPSAPPVCTPEQEANGTCTPPARQPDEPPTDE